MQRGIDELLTKLQRVNGRTFSRSFSHTFGEPSTPTRTKSFEDNVVRRGSRTITHVGALSQRERSIEDEEGSTASGGSSIEDLEQNAPPSHCIQLSPHCCMLQEGSTASGGSSIEDLE